MTWPQYVEWQTFVQMEPCTVDRIDYGFAVLAATVANSAGGKKGGASFTVDEFRTNYFNFRDSYEPKETITNVDDWAAMKQTLTASFKASK